MSTANIRSDWVGKTIDGRFPLLQWLGGAEGSGVFLTELPEHPPQMAAIKLIPADGRDADAQITEWVAKMPLVHPHLMRLFYTGQCLVDGAPLLYAVTEYAEENLAEILPERSLTPTEVSEMLAPVLDALSYLHGKGLAHGRLKPSNILVVHDQLKLSWDNLHVVGNSVNYLPAPEAHLSPAADLWSLGVLLVEAFTQHPPLWDRSTQNEPAVPESIPQPFAGIARECLHPDPALRCTLSTVKIHLEARPLPETASGTDAPAPIKFRPAALIAAVLVLIAVIAILLTRSHPAEPASPIAEEQPATASRPRPSPYPANHSSKAAPVKNEVALPGDVVERVMPDIPQKAIGTIRGTVKVSIRLTVGPNGEVSNAAIDSPGSTYFATRAQQAAEHWKFKPAQVNGHIVSSEWILHFVFTSTETQVTPVRVSP